MASTDAVEVLLVEDQSNDVELTLRALAEHSLAGNVKVVTDGAEALDFMFGRGAYADRRSKVDPKLILLDLKLPKVGGLEVLRSIKSDARTKNVPVVVLTSSSEIQDIVESYRLGVNSYMVKPVDFDEYMQCVSRIGSYWLECNQAPR